MPAPSKHKVQSVLYGGCGGARKKAALPTQNNRHCLSIHLLASMAFAIRLVVCGEQSCGEEEPRASGSGAEWPERLITSFANSRRGRDGWLGGRAGGQAEAGGRWRAGGLAGGRAGGGAWTRGSTAELHPPALPPCWRPADPAGKSSLMQRFLSDTFSGDPPPPPTFSADFGAKRVRRSINHHPQRLPPSLVCPAMS